MKIDRLIGIITILLQKEKTTTAQLAERFEVSRRTIQRDIDHICKAGIPIGESERTIEPYFIMFRWSAWYVYGYCLTKQDYRLFKLNRLSKLQSLKTSYEERVISEKELDFDNYIWRDDIKLSALFDISVKYRLIDEHGPECITFDNQSGKLLFVNNFTNRSYLLQWILSYGDSVKVIEPPDLVDEICLNAKNILHQYK
ncbi:transcriptional regulator [Lacrimispora sp.]|uniref:helix-turn-helix transcriptional regulator n=1 Tax=Lacrimispora sp. TaxID=2719234 RepID=UPI0032E449C6